MPKSKLFISIFLIVILSALLSGCFIYDAIEDVMCCFSGLLPLPIAVAAIKIFK